MLDKSSKNSDSEKEPWDSLDKDLANSEYEERHRSQPESISRPKSPALGNDSKLNQGGVPKTDEKDKGTVKKLNKKRANKARKGFLGFFVNRYRVTYLLIIAIVAWGMLSVLTLPREANPEVKIPLGIVATAFPGASPSDVEQLVTDEIEERVENLDNISQITSSSSLGFSSVAVEFEASADLDESIQDLKDAVDEITDLPDDAEDPNVIEVNFNDLPIVTISLVGDLTDEEFRILGESVQDELEGITNVSDVSLSGTREREVSIALDPGELERNQISVSQVITAITQNNIDFPVGEIEVSETIYNISTKGRFQDVSDISNIVVKSTPSGTILLSDIAEIKNELQELNTISRISLNRQEARTAISLQVFKQTGENIIEIVDAVKERVEGFRDEQVIPHGVEVEITNDNSQFIRNDLRTLGGSGVQTVIIILVLLTLALSFEKALLGALSIPLVFFMSLGILSLTGSTINSLTLFSLVLSLGLLVDTVIVILEGIHDGLRQGMRPREASLYALETYKWPVMAGVLTTIAAFVPMFLVSGIVGEFLKTFPITVSATLGSSLFVSLVIMPSVIARVLRKREQKKGAPIFEKESLMEKYLIRRLEKFYTPRLKNLLIEKKKKWTLTLSVFALLIASIALVVVGVIPVSLFPQVDIDNFFVEIELPAGSTLEKTETLTAEVERELLDLPELKNYVTTIGSGRLNTGDPSENLGQAGENTAQIVVNLVDEGKRDRRSFEVAADLREQFSLITSAEVEVVELSAGPPTGSPIEVRVTGEDLIALAEVAEQIKAELEDIPGTVNVQSDNEITPPEFSFFLNRESLGRFGLNAALVGSSLRAAVQGVEVTTLTFEGDDINVVVKQSDGEINNPEELRNLNIISPTGDTVRLEQIADFEITPAVETIRHRDLERLVNVRADTEGVNSADINEALEGRLSELDIPAGVNVEIGGEVEEIDQSFTELWFSMIVAVILIFLIMVMQFNSFKQPFIILITLPFAVIGVIVGTLVIGLDFGFSTFLGIVALSGIVVNDAIILIDRINYNVQTRQLKITDAAVEAGEARLQPVIMTTLTTIAGVLPLAFIDEFWRGLSVAVAFGIAFATILTLVFVPMFYLKFEGKRWLRRYGKKQ